MKTWRETFEVLTEAKTCIENGQPCAIVVLTNVKGSAFRRPGAKLLIRADGSMTGNVSGGCLENDLRDRALTCLASGRQETVHYNTGSDEDIIWGLGLGCDGELDLLIVPVLPPGNWVSDVLKQMKNCNVFTLAWPLAAHPEGSPCLLPDGRASRPAEPPDTFLDTLEPPPDLVIVGAGDDAIPLTEIAVTAGFRVTVVDHRPGYLTRERFPRASAILQLRPESAAGNIPSQNRTMVVIKNHALEMDKKWAAFFDATDVFYIGILGPQQRCAKVRAGMTSGKNDRVHGPAGLDIGSEGAEQIALSIIAEMLAAWSGRDAAHLRDRDAPIHSR
jgi:xanthine dehydrogenase accessory factor